MCLEKAKPSMLTDAQIPSLNAIRNFVVVARHLSFTKAAQELHVTAGAVSRMVRMLEENLGAALFHRVGSLLELTSAGVVYQTQISDLFDRVTMATHAVRGLQHSNALSVAALPTFAVRWLSPRLAGFQREHPDISIDLLIRDFTQEAMSFSKKCFDIAISWDDGAWPGMETTLFMGEDIGIFCAPALLKRTAPIRTPRDLSSYPLLLQSTRPNAWSEYFTAQGVSSCPKPSSVGYEDFLMLIEAATVGMGIAMIPTIFVEKEIATGLLVQPLRHTIQMKKGYYLICPSEHGNVKKIRLFKKWLLREVGAAALFE